MPSLHQLWKFHSQIESQNRVKVILAQSFFHTKPTFSHTSGEFVFQFEHTHSSRRLSELADPGSPLSIPEASSCTPVSPLVNGEVWNSCSCNPCQALLEKNQPCKFKKKLHSTLMTSLYGTLNAPAPMFAPRFHVCLLGLPLETSTVAVSSLRCRDHQNRVCSRKIALLNSTYNHDGSRPLLRLPFWRCRVAELCNGDEFFHESQQNKKPLMDWPLSTAIAFHLMQFGLFFLPAVPKSLEILTNSLNGVASSIAAQAGVVLDSTTDKCSPEVAENCSEGSLSSSGLRLLSGACCLPHPEKQDTGGEDAYFICADKQVIGVADGVGGWADVGIDAGEYARQLMNHSLIAAQQEPAGCIDTVRVMEIAHSKTTCRGSSTACILALSNNCLQAANLGDSGFLVVRTSRLVFKSPPQQHNFNVPFQLENGGGDPPDAAQVFLVEVAAGDVIVAGTDGLFDNLYDKDIVGLVVQASRVGSSPDITAKKIAALARERAQDCNRQTPFSAAAQDAGFRFYGGKMDDITVIVSYVVK